LSWGGDGGDCLRWMNGKVLEHAGFRVRIHALVDLWDCGKLPIKPTSAFHVSLFGFLNLGGFEQVHQVWLSTFDRCTSEFFLNVGETQIPMRQ